MVNYPMTTYHFIVDWGGNQIPFTEVSGLNMEIEVIEYREGSSVNNHYAKMPGLRKYSNLVLKRGLVKGDHAFYHWMQSIHANAVERRDLVISLLNENHEPVMQWKVRRAWPCKIWGPSLKAGANEVAIETIELAHEGLELVN